ncbi:MAG: glycerophosphodiester phosphodiesterase [Caldibacillus sp.]
MGYLVLIVLMMILWIFVYSLPPRRSHRLHLFERKQPLVIAHQGGKGLAPSSTMPAFQKARSLGVDVLEFDVHMTSDGHLVAIHDPTVDRTTDGSGKVNDMTLAEIKRLDAGYSFQDEHGSYPYRGKGVTIPTVEEIFSATSDPDMLYIIEIKHTNDPALYEEIATKLWGIIEKFRLEERVIIASFDQNIIDTVLKISRGQALVSAGKKEATKFVLTHKLFLNGLYRPGVDALHFPLKSSGFNLVDKKLIRGAQRRGMQIHYWTVNDPETMGKLLELGADGIMTDYPDRLMKLINK